MEKGDLVRDKLTHKKMIVSHILMGGTLRVRYRDVDKKEFVFLEVDEKEVEPFVKKERKK